MTHYKRWRILLAPNGDYFARPVCLGVISATRPYIERVILKLPHVYAEEAQ